MERQKEIQKNWYDQSPPKKEDRVVRMSIQTHIERFKKMIPIREAPLSLNCGCGRGGQEDLFGPSIGIDLSFTCIQSFVQKGKIGVVADMEHLPFKNQVFDIVYGFGILHHLNDLQKGVSEGVRVLKKGGYIGFGGENNGLCPFLYPMSFLYRNWKIEKGSHRIREKKLRRVFEDLGVKEFKFFREGMTIYGLGKVIFKVTSFAEKFFSKIPLIDYFASHCYFGGRKI